MRACSSFIRISIFSSSCSIAFSSSSGSKLLHWSSIIFCVTPGGKSHPNIFLMAYSSVQLVYSHYSMNGPTTREPLTSFQDANHHARLTQHASLYHLYN